MAEAVSRQVGLHQLRQLLVRQVAMTHRHQLALEARKGVVLDDTLLDGKLHDLLHVHQMIVECHRPQTAYRREVELEVLDELHVEPPHLDIVLPISAADEVRQVAAGVEIAHIGAACPVDADTLGVLAVVLIEERQEGTLRLRTSRDSVPDHLGSDEPVNDQVVPVRHLGMAYEIVQPSVDSFGSPCLCLPTGRRIGASRLHIPAGQRHAHLRRVLAYFPIDGDTSHNRAQSILIHLLAVHIEQQFKCTPHNMYSGPQSVNNQLLSFKYSEPDIPRSSRKGSICFGYCPPERQRLSSVFHS